jgi:hypothetical protein
MGLEVMVPNIDFNWCPARFSRAEPIRLIPNRNSASPPIKVRKSKMLKFAAHPSYAISVKRRVAFQLRH